MKRAAEFLLLAGALVVAGNSVARRAQAAPVKASSLKPSKSASHNPAKTHMHRGVKSKYVSKKSRRNRMSKQKAPTADRIREIQAGLARAGFYEGEPTGNWDAETVDAMKRFQQAQGLNASGKIDALTLQKLGLGSDVAGVSAPRPPLPGSAAPSPTPNLPRD